MTHTYADVDAGARMARVAAIGWPYDLLTLDEWESLDIGEGHHVESAEYWILDGDPLTLSAYALQADGGYRLTGDFHGQSSLTACGTSISLDLEALTRR